MKKSFVFTAIALALVVLSSCGSAPVAPAAKKTEEILSHQNSAFGGQPPFWVTTETYEIEKSPDWADLYAFKFEANGESQRGAELAASQLDAMQVIAQQVSVRVQAKFAGAEVGDRNLIESYMENIVKNVAEAKFSGLKREGTYWVRIRMFNDDETVKGEEYRVRVFYSIPKKLLDDQIQKVIDGTEADAPKTEGERTARLRVREALAEGF